MSDATTGTREAEAPSLDPRRTFAAPEGATLRVVPLAAVVDPLAVQHSPEVVAAYSEAMRAGSPFPPIAVLSLGGRLLVADGHKRLAAWRALGASEIVVEVWTLRRWLRDQGDQAARTVRRLTRGVGLLATRPREGAALLVAVPLHWWRVARSLAAHAGRRSSG